MRTKNTKKYSIFAVYSPENKHFNQKMLQLLPLHRILLTWWICSKHFFFSLELMRGAEFTGITSMCMLSFWFQSDLLKTFKYQRRLSCALRSDWRIKQHKIKRTNNKDKSTTPLEKLPNSSEKKEMMRWIFGKMNMGLRKCVSGPPFLDEIQMKHPYEPTFFRLLSAKTQHWNTKTWF